jgi:hypothetical protein
LNSAYLLVMAIVRFVRPWYAPSKTITAPRPVKARASFTAFSIASAPPLASNVFFANVPGVRRFSSSDSST